MSWKQSQISLIQVPSALGVWRHYYDDVAQAPAQLLAHPGALRARLVEKGWKIYDAPPIRIPARPCPGNSLPPNKDEVYEVCSQVSKAVDDALAHGDIPLVLGGDHSIAIGSVAGVSAWAAAEEKSVGVIWMDAHPDMNTPRTSPTQNIHGMPLACCVELAGEDQEAIGLLGRLAHLVEPKLKGRNVCLVGDRDVDLGSHGYRGEERIIADAGVREIKITENTDAADACGLMEAAISIVTRETEGFHLSFDIDFVDPKFAPAAGTPFLNGATVEATMAALEVVRESGKMLSMDLVEIHSGRRGADLTLGLAIDFLLHLFTR
ncbi:MAG: arginase family protein [Bryobacteraceae bacterium]